MGFAKESGLCPVDRRIPWKGLSREWLECDGLEEESLKLVLKVWSPDQQHPRYLGTCQQCKLLGPPQIYWIRSNVSGAQKSVFQPALSGDPDVVEVKNHWPRTLSLNRMFRRVTGKLQITHVLNKSVAWPKEGHYLWLYRLAEHISRGHHSATLPWPCRLKSWGRWRKYYRPTHLPYRLGFPGACLTLKGRKYSNPKSGWCKSSVLE